MSVLAEELAQNLYNRIAALLKEATKEVELYNFKLNELKAAEPKLEAPKPE